MNNSIKNEIHLSLFALNIKAAKDLSLRLRSLSHMANVCLSLDEIDLEQDLYFMDFDFFKSNLRSLEKTIIVKTVVCYGAQSFFDLELLDRYPVYGVCPKDESFKYVARSIIQNKRQSIRNQSLSLSKDTVIKDLQRKNLSLERNSIFNHDKVNSYELFTNFLNDLSIENDFLSEISSAFSNWSMCESFSIMSFDKDSLKYRSLSLGLRKYKKLPSMKSAQKNQSDYFDMLSNAFIEEFGEEPKVMKLTNDSSLILIGRFSTALKGLEAWDFFAKSICIKSFNYNIENNYNNSTLDMIHNFDDVYYNLKATNERFFTIDFNNLKRAVLDMNENRFYWKSFISSLQKEILNLESITKVYSESIHTLYFSCDEKAVKESFSLVQKIIEDFDYWKFFEKESTVLGVSHFPSINLTAMSSAGIIRNSLSQAKVNLSNHLMSN